MEWIESYGGPLICLEAALENSWKGNDGLSVAHASAKTDYDRACESNEYTSVLPLVGGHALIFSMGALETSVWRDFNGTTYFVHVECSEPDVDEDKLLKKMGEGLFVHPKRKSLISFASSALILFDSVDSGSDKTNKWLSLVVNVGHYEVLTQEFNPDPETSFIVHKLEQLSAA